MYETQPILRTNLNMGRRFYLEAPDKLWDREDLSQPVMCASDAEKKSNLPFVANARGNVLIFGLGIGLIVHAVQGFSDVRSILVVERHKEVVDLVLPQMRFNNKVSVVVGNAYSYAPPTMFNTVWLDIWTAPKDAAEDPNRDDLDALLKRFAPFVHSGGYLNRWRREDAA